jgi:hypothetical protein
MGGESGFTNKKWHLLARLIDKSFLPFDFPEATCLPLSPSLNGTSSPH